MSRVYARNYYACIPKLISCIYKLFLISTMALNPPLLKLYDYVNFALDDINKFAKGQGYTVSRFRLKTDKQTPPTVRKIWLQCTKGRSYKRTARERLTSSHITNCPFALTITCTAIGWQVEVQDPTYNYRAFAHPIALPHYRQCTEETKKTITNILASSIAPSKIFISLLKKDIVISLKDIYNERQLNKKQLLGSLTPVQALLEALNEYRGNDFKLRYYFAHKEDDSNYLKYLFFAHLESLKYLQKNPNILLLNCTYKTNKFKMPFLHIVGVNNSRQNFKLTYYFLLGEIKNDYNFII